MDVLGSPIVTMILNILATALVAHGIISADQRDTFVQLFNNAIAAIVTLTVAIYSIFKMVELKKHQITVSGQQPPSTNIEITTPATAVKSDNFTTVPTPPSSQSGLPKTA